MNGQSLVRDERVVDQPGEVDGPDRHAAHVRIAQDVVQVVRRVDAADDRLQEGEPLGIARAVLGRIFQDEKGHVIGVQLLAGREGTMGAAADLLDDVAQVLPDDHLADPFVGEPELFQEIFVEKVAEGAVADVVHQGGDAEQFLDIVL